MGRKMTNLICSPEDRQFLEMLENNPLEDTRVAVRAGIVLACIEKKPIEQIAEQFQVSRSVIFRWRSRFCEEGIAGLRDKPRKGKPPKYDEAFETQIFELLKQPPPEGMNRWDGTTLARMLNASDDAVWRVLRRHGIALARKRVWKIPVGAKLVACRSEVEGIYLAPPLGMFVLREQDPSLRESYVITRDKKAGEALLAASRDADLSLKRVFEILMQFRRDNTVEFRPQEEVLAFLDEMLKNRPPEQPMHVLVLGGASDFGITGWMAAHKNVKFFFYSTMEDMVKIAEQIFPLKNEQGDYYELVRRLLQYPSDALPFIWKKKAKKYQ